jgi:hypothetical protein
MPYTPYTRRVRMHEYGSCGTLHTTLLSVHIVRSHAKKSSAAWHATNAIINLPAIASAAAAAAATCTFTPAVRRPLALAA